MKADVQIRNLDELKEWVQSWAANLPHQQLILLSGNPGAGKTQLVQFLVEILGGTGVSSPTFALQHRYITARGEVAHFDLYRVESEEELETTGLWDAFGLEKGWIIVEWPDLIEGLAAPEGWGVMGIRFRVLENGDRQITLTRP